LRLIVGTASDIRIVRDDASVLISSTSEVAAPSFVGHSMRKAKGYRTMRHDMKLLLSGLVHPAGPLGAEPSTRLAIISCLMRVM
jgi:hypothetical protein